jgi:hypothetical protein
MSAFFAGGLPGAAVLVLQTCLVDRAASAAAAFAHIERDLISKLHRLEIRGFVEYLATIISLRLIRDVVALALAELCHRSWVSAFRTAPGSDWSFDMLTGSNSARRTMSTSVSCHFHFSSVCLNCPNA